jgi:hypothetical protein
MTYRLNKNSRVNFTNPLKLWPFFQAPPNIQKLSLTPIELSKILTYPNPYKLGHKIFKKDQNTPVFHFLKKLKKKNILEVNILNSEF